MTGHQREHRYLRVFPLPAFGIDCDFEIAWVQIAIDEALAALAERPLAVRLHTLAGAPVLTNLTRIAEQILVIPRPAPDRVEVSFSGAFVPRGHALVVELLAADDPGGTEPARIDTTSGARLLMTLHGHER